MFFTRQRSRPSTRFQGAAFVVGGLLLFLLAACQYREKDPRTGEWVNISREDYDAAVGDEN